MPNFQTAEGLGTEAHKTAAPVNRDVPGKLGVPAVHVTGSLELPSITHLWVGKIPEDVVRYLRVKLRLTILDIRLYLDIYRLA